LQTINILINAYQNLNALIFNIRYLALFNCNHL